MKKLLIVVISIVGLSCQEDKVPQIAPQVLPEPTQIAGLELTFIDPGILWGYSSIAFTDEFTGYITLARGVIIKTTDGGKTWTDLKVENYVALNDVFFVDANEGWAVGGTTICYPQPCNSRGAVILHTTNAGATWSEVKVNLTKKIELASVWFRDKTNGFAVGDNLILRTIDGGATWAEIPVDLYVGYNLVAKLLNVKFFDDQHGIVSADAGKIVRTDDGGATWEVMNAPFNEPGYTAVSFASNNLLYAAGQVGIYRSQDYGASWDKLPQQAMIVTDLNFISQNVGFAFGPGNYLSIGDDPIRRGAIYFTNDGGQTWTGSSAVHETDFMLAASFPTDKVGYAISSERVVKIVLK
jgi:photosystem II stability/assembly factor-like uncharacterized protein